MQKTTKLSDDTLLLYADLSNSEIRAVQRRVSEGSLFTIAKGVVSSLSEEHWPALIARNRAKVLSALRPGSVISFNSAFDGGVPVDGVFHLTGGRRASLELPGLRVEIWPGPKPQPGDNPMLGRDIFFPSEARLLLENLQPSRGADKRTVGAEKVEARLLSILEARGEKSLNDLRDRARELSVGNGWAKEFSKLDSLIGSILRTRPSELLTRKGKALTAVLPYDSNRLDVLENLAQVLRKTPLPVIPSPSNSVQAKANFAFLESYFSNFIEGTEFDVREARAIIFDGAPIAHRPKDSHDILGVYEQALNPEWSTLSLARGESVLEQLRSRHWHQMQFRPETGPGEFKTLANRAGNTEFVAPSLVRGTLIEGSLLLDTIPSGIARALYAMFLVSEVHPFNDGNGRLARLVMNAELSNASACRIIIPTLYREQYLDCLRVLSRTGDPMPFIEAMRKIHSWSSKFNYENLDEVLEKLSESHAFERSLVQFRLEDPKYTS